MHVFKYSIRKGTKAAVMTRQVDGNIKEQRSQKLIKLSNENQKKCNQEYVGKEVEVLFEEQEGKYFKGHTANYIMVKYETNEDLENRIKAVKVDEAQESYLIAKK